jgi:cell wall-associated NlpC family hydrolase
MAIKASYLILAGGGAILVWGGFKGKSIPDAFRNVVQGKDPTISTTAFPIQTSPAAYSTAAGIAAGGGPSPTGNAIADDANRYIGTPYVWAGIPGPHGVGPWDCSSFSNAVIGRDLRMAIPLYRAGTYHGQAHGPATGIWLVWTGAFTIHRQDCVAGDLCVWQTHMGIATSSTHYTSAYDSQEGVVNKPIDGGGPSFEKLFIRRLKGVTARG